MIPAIQELNFPKIDGKQYATLSHATVNLADMGEKTISTQVKIDGDIVPDFSQDWEVEFQGEKYIMPLRQPQGAKENTSLNSTIGLTFQHWAIWQLKRWTFVTMQPIDTGTAVADEEVASVQLNLKDFCDLFGQVLRYYYGDTITIDLNPAWQYDNAPTAIEISHSYIWNVLIDAFHDKYGVRWAIEPREDNDNTVKGGERYVIKIGYPTTEVDHIFEYGFEGGLLKLERQVQSEDIRNMIKGRGGDTNIPFRYFKDTDPGNPDFAPDPDWVEELKNIYFKNLMPATYRSYIQGWKAAHISKYPGYKAVGENNAYSPWAYQKGFTDTKFHPVEFVADEITLNPQEGDRQVQIYPDYSPYVKKGSSIDVYGPLLAPLDNNDDIYPTIQGTGLDIAVDVEQIESDDVADSTENDARLIDVDGCKYTAKRVAAGTYKTVTLPKTKFTVPVGQTANLITDAVDILSATAYALPGVLGVPPVIVEVAGHAELVETTVKVYSVTTQQERSASGIPAGDWYYEITAKIHNLTLNRLLDITVGIETPRLLYATLSNETWKNTFDIWVKNIWNTQKGVDKDGNVIKETDSQYSERVWKPILGDREGNTAKVVFTSGMLLHEDYEFEIVDFPVPDTSKTYTDANGVRHDSHWRITLAKSDAELEATGLYVPSTQKQGKAGNTFAFIGTEMTHVPYVVDAEIRLDDWKKDHLGEVKEIKPTFVVTTDRVRLNNEGKPDALINQLHVGNSLRIADKRFIQPMGDRVYETLYLQSLTYTFREPTPEDATLNPDVEIVLSNEYTTSANPVSVMQGEISSMQRLLGSISNVEQIVRAVGDKLYLRKDGISDISYSPTRFFSLLTSGNFRAGIVGGAGWGFFKDENGNWVLEADRVNVRQEMQVNTLVINQAEGRGGMEIDTAAFMEVTHVVDTAEGFVCYFDQKNGSVANLFHVDDVAYCNRWTPENQELKFYKRRVVAVGVDSITLSKTDVNGTGIPAEKDNIIHFGNYTDKTRQYVKVRDVVGGGYERYIENLDSVNAEGVEYYFVGKQAGESRWFVGNKDRVPYSGKGDGSYIEYKDRKFNLNNVALSLTTTIGDTLIGDYITDTANDLLQVEYSQTGADNTWHKVWQEADKYMRQSKDGGKTWTGAMLISGKDGSSFANNLLWNSNFQNGRTSWDDWGGGNTSRILVTEDDKKWMHIITRGDSSQGISQGDTNRIYAQEKTYTVSALVRSNTAGQHISLNIHCISSTGVNLIGINNRFDVGTTPQRVSATFKAVAGTTRLRLMVGAATTDPIEVYVTDLKIEEGENSSTQWTPNPEEMIGKDAPYTVFQWAIGDFTQPTGTWSNHPLNPKPGEAVWMRQGTVTPPSTTPMWDTSNYMRVTGTAGQSGSDVYLLDIDNEVIAVACDSGGNPLLGQFPVKATARVYKGGAEVTSGVAFSSEYNPEVSATLSGGDITIGGLYADTATLTITATVAGLTLYSTIRLYKVKPGINGAPAVVYSIEPSVSVVTKSLTTGLSANQLTCTKYKTTGASARTTTKENILKATVYTNGVAGTEQIIANATKETGTVALTNDTTGVAFALCNSSSGVELDREFVPVISDASGLQIGGTNLLRKTNQGTENWMTSTSSGAEINLSPADDAQGVVLTNMATGAVLSSGWQMIGFRLPPGILKTQRYYTLSFTAKADALMTVSGRIQISGSTGANLMSNILSFNFSPDETRHTFLLKTNSTAQTNAHSLWCYLFCNAKWNTIEIRDLKLEEGTVATEWSPAPQDFNYLTAALQESGRSEGGLMLASLLRLGYTVEDGEYRVMSGINGIANPTAENRDIAIWAGGEMRDATDPENSDYDDNAAYAIRHDGNGYACQGNVRFIGGRILIGKNRDVAGKIKSDSDFAKNCVALDGEGLTLYKNGVERLIAADRSVGTDFISKEETTNWSYAVRSPQELLFKQYHTHTEGLMGPDGEIITQPVDSYDWFATGKVAEILNISPGATAYPNRIIPVGEVLNVSNFTTHITNISFTGQYVHLTATLQLCYDDSSGKRVVVATGKRSFVRNSATPSRWQATISLGKHTVQVAAAYYLNVVVNTTTPTHGKETGTSVSSKVNMSASGDVRKSNDNVTIIGIDGMVSLWGNGGILINGNGAMIKGSLKVNGKNVQTMS